MRQVKSPLKQKAKPKQEKDVSYKSDMIGLPDSDFRKKVMSKMDKNKASDSKAKPTQKKEVKTSKASPAKMKKC